jgi:hypothetical protein
MLVLNRSLLNREYILINVLKASAGNRTPAVQPVSIPHDLSRFLIYNDWNWVR